MDNSKYNENNKITSIEPKSFETKLRRAPIDKG